MITIRILIILPILLFICYLYRMISNIKVCVCTCGKNENKYARGFVEYYKKYNDNKIFIYDNNEEKSEKFESLISDYIN